MRILEIIKKYRYIILFVAVAVVISSLSICGVLYIIDNLSNNTAETTDSDTTTDEVSSKISFYYGSSDNEIHVDVLEDVKVNSLDNDNFTDIDGYKYYTENGKTVSKFGIDVSEFQKEIDWAEVQKAGVEFAMIRAGFRGYTEGGLFEDSNVHKNIQGALDNGIEVGIYFFSQATTIDEAIEEAKYAMEIVKDYNITYPIAFDWELTNEPDARTNNITPEQVTSFAEAFCKEIEKNGYKAMIYYSEYYGYVLYDLSKFTDYRMWYVEYSDLPDFYYAFDMWQYSESGRVNGIDGDVDLNLWFGDSPA